MAASRQVTSMTASQRGRQRSTTKNTARACRTHAIASGSVTSAASTATLAATSNRSRADGDDVHRHAIHISPAVRSPSPVQAVNGRWTRCLSLGAMADAATPSSIGRALPRRDASGEPRRVSQALAGMRGHGDNRAPPCGPRGISSPDEPASRSRDRAARALLVAVVWLTWPLAAHLGTHLPSTEAACSFDTLLIAWVLAWQTHALATAPLHFAQANIYHPARHALFYCEAGVGALPYYAPAFLLTGSPALALNVTLLGGVALTAWALHLVVRRWTSSHLGGTVAAWTFLTTRWVLWEWGPVAPNYVVLPYFPLIVLLVATPAARLGDALRLVPLLVLQGLTSIYVAAAAMIPAGLIAAGRLVRRSTRASGLRLAVALSLGAALLP